MESTQFSIAEIVRRWASETPDVPVIVHGDETLTWAQLDHRSSQVANALLADGIERQDRVAYLGLNDPVFFELQFGACKIAAVPVAVNWRLAPSELVGVLNDAEARVLVVSAELAETVAGIRSRLETVDHVLVFGKPVDGFDSYHDWAGRMSEIDPQVASDPEDVVIQCYTSGTTGVPKGVQLTNRNFVRLALNLSPEFGMQREAVTLVILPVFHVGGSSFGLGAIAAGGRMVIEPVADPARVLRSIERNRVTTTLLVPALIGMLLDELATTTADLSSLAHIIYGAAPIDEDLLQRAMQTFDCDFAQVYGMTETCGAVCVLRPEDHDPRGPRRHLLRSAGKAFPWVELKIVDADTGEQLPAGVVGEIWVRSHQSTVGYWKRPDETAALLTADGWVRTGDAGHLDEEGYLFVEDRIKDMIVSGGENVYSVEVENALLSHPAVAEVAVIGVPDAKWGEAIKAVVAVRPGSTTSSDDLIAHARERIAGYKCPKSVDFVDVLPRNPTGKVLKFELRKRYWDGLSRNVN